MQLVSGSIYQLCINNDKKTKQLKVAANYWLMAITTELTMPQSNNSLKTEILDGIVA